MATRILLVNETFYPDQAATATYLTDVALGLSQAGFSVSVLSGRRGYLDKSNEYVASEDWNGIKIFRANSLIRGFSGKFGRVFYSIGLSIAFAFRYLLLPKQDIVLMLSAPPLIACFFPWVVNTKKTRLVQWLMDINPEQAFRAGWLRRASIIGRTLSWLLRRSLKRSEKILVLDSYMERLLHTYKIPKEKVAVLPLWGNQEGISQHAATSRESAISPPKGSFAIMYAGNHSLCHPLLTVLEAARTLKDESRYQFYFVGGGPRFSEVMEYKEQHQLDNIHLHEYVSREQLAATLNSASLHVISMGDEYVGVVHPSKLYPILELTKPFVFIGPEDSAIGDILRKEALDWQVVHGDVGKLVKVINKFRNSEADMLEKPLSALSRNFKKENSLKYLLDLVS